MAIALTITDKEYVLKCDRDLDETQKTVFLLRPLSAKVMMTLVGEAQEASAGGRGEMATVMVEKGLVGWSNFLDSAGKQVKFGKDMEKNINLLPLEYLIELSDAIASLSTLSKAEAKN